MDFIVTEIRNTAGEQVHVCRGKKSSVLDVLILRYYRYQSREFELAVKYMSLELGKQ